MGKKVIVMAGTSSGVGKTSMTVGILRALRNRGMKVQAFKVGPGKPLAGSIFILQGPTSTTVVAESLVCDFN